MNLLLRQNQNQLVTVDSLEDAIADSRELLRQLENLPKKSAERPATETAAKQSLETVLDKLWWVITRSFRWWYTDMKLADTWSLKEAFRRAANRGWMNLSECKDWIARCNAYEGSGAHDNLDAYGNLREQPNTHKLNPQDAWAMLADAEKLSRTFRTELLDEPVYTWC